MATSFISTSAELVLLNTTIRPGVIILPSTNTIPGRILTFKDTRGSFGVSSITFSTAAVNQFFENNTRAVTYTDPFGAYSFIAGFDNKWYTIGGSRMFSATISSITTINHTAQTISSGSITTSTLQFRDTSTTSTNTLFVLSTNIYYSSPVSFFVLGPTKAPKSLFTPIRRSFAPNQISGLQLWLDAADINTLVLSGINVNQWNDKSGNRRNAVTSSSANPPTYSATSNCLQFRSALTQSLTINQAFGNALVGAKFSIFIVGRRLATDYQGFLTGEAIATNGNLLIGMNGTSYNPGYYNGSVATVTIPNYTANDPVYIMGFDSLITQVQAVINGGTPGTAAAGDLVSFAGPSIGRRYGGTGAQTYHTVDVFEEISYVPALTTPQRQQVEGYLAWKWGLVGSLPSNHPFKNSPP